MNSLIRVEYNVRIFNRYIIHNLPVTQSYILYIYLLSITIKCFFLEIINI